MAVVQLESRPAIHCLQQVQRCEHELRWHGNERPRQQHVVGLSVDYVLTGFKERFRQSKFRPCSDMRDASQRTQGCDNAAGSHSWTSISVSGQQFRSAKCRCAESTAEKVRPLETNSPHPQCSSAHCGSAQLRNGNPDVEFGSNGTCLPSLAVRWGELPRGNRHRTL